MTEITQADHNVAEEHFNVWYPNTAWGYDALVDTLARHRLEERAKIVAWLRESPHFINAHQIADAIEAGEHFTLQETGDELHD